MTRPLTPRPLSPAQARHQAWLGRLADLLDNAIAVPGTGCRVGWDPILGLVPGLGDLVTPIVGSLIVVQAFRLGLPRVVQLRMVGNIAIDFLIGAVPVVGDLFDFTWKANAMNMALLEQHAYEIRKPSRGDWLFVGAMLAVIAACAILPVLIAWWVWQFLRGLM